MTRNPVARTVTTKEAALVEALATAAENGVKITREEAGTIAGYGQGEAARVSAARAIARPAVQEALRKRLREMAIMDAPASYAMLRHVRDTGGIGHRLTAAAEMLKVAGISSEEQAQPGAIMVQVVLPGELGTLLAQAQARAAQVIEHAPQSEGAHSLAEGEGEPAKGRARRRDPSPRPSKPKPKKKGGDRKPRSKAAARGRRTITALKPDVSGGGTEGGG